MTVLIRQYQLEIKAPDLLAASVSYCLIAIIQFYLNQKLSIIVVA